MKKIVWILLAGFGLMFQLNAQERYIFTQHYVNPILINPGATGFSDAHTLLLNYRNKWAGFPGSPKTYAFSYDGLIMDKAGLGLFLMKDEFGSLEVLKGQLSYAYHLMGDNFKMGLGFTTEYIHYRAKSLISGPPDFDETDPFLKERQIGDKFFDFTFGAHGMYGNQLLFDIVLPGMIRTRLDNGDGTQENERSFNFIVGLGYKYKFPGYDFEVTPSLYIKKLNKVPFHVEGNLLMSFYQGQLLGGVSYAYGAEDRLGAMLGTGLNNFKFFYSYNVSLNSFQTYSNGAHELTVAFVIPRS